MQHTLYYLPLRARAEATRMILAYGEINYEDVTVDMGTWSTTMKSNTSKFPFGQVPSLTLPSGTSVAQSGAIIRYVAKLAGIYPDNLEQAAIGDMVVELCQEMNPINPIVNWFELGSDAYNASYSTYFGTLDARLESLQRILGTGQFFGGESVSHGDFALFHIFDNTLLVKPDSLADFPQLKEWLDRMNAIPQLKQYLQQRPQPPLVGKESSFIRSMTVG